MVKGCGNNCMKYCLFAFNLVFVVFGLTLMSLGIYILVRSEDLRNVIETPDAAAILVVIIGVSVAGVAFFGCCGAINEGRCMLVTYSLIIGIVFVIELAAAVLILVYSGKINWFVRDGLDRAVQKARPSDPDDTFTRIMDTLQWNVKCCGGRETTDWAKYHSVQYGQVYPQSCCFNPNDAPSTTCGGRGVQPFSKPCADAVGDLMKVYLGVIAAFIIIVAVVQLIAACFACSIASANKG